jgi:hypothetical protein
MSTAAPAPEPQEPKVGTEDEVGTEEVDAILLDSEEHIVVQARRLAPAQPRALVPAVQAAAVAAGGFVAGAAVVGLVNRRHGRALTAGAGAGAAPRRRLLRRSRAARVEALQIVSTRSLLVDVHLLDGGEQR